MQADEQPRPDCPPLHQRVDDVARGHQRVLELLARGAPLPDTLAALCQGVEAVAAGARCSVTTVDAASRRLDLVFGGGLGQELQRQIHGLPLDKESWAPARAAATGAPAVDEQLDRGRWGFGACWSTPIRSTGGDVVGTLDLWWPHAPGALSADPWPVELARDLAGISIERDQLLNQLQRRSFTDPVTGLPNRHVFTTMLRACLDGSIHGASGIAVLAVDLDRFKLLNNSLGHRIGNEILAEVARRLQGCLRPEDLVARFHADEFLVMLTNVRDADAATHVASRIRATLQDAIPAAGREVFVTPSIGIALRDGQVAGETLIERSLSAMHLAKERGWGGCQVYDTEVSDTARRRLDLEQDLWRAVDRHELAVLYQPIVKLSSGRPVAVEALVRWNHRDRGLVSPADFIPLAEESGAIVPIGRWVLNAACRQAASWRGVPGLRHLKMSVNISPRQFHEPDFVSDVADALRTSQLEPGRLILEITEGVVMSDVQSVIDTLQELKALGVRLAVDDFGAGYSSLSYLKRFPLDSLKIDKSFISAVDVGPADLAIVEAVIVLAARLGLRVVAEGVEDRPQAVLLRDLGCALGQGYLFSRPVPADELEVLCRRPDRDAPAAVA